VSGLVYFVTPAWKRLALSQVCLEQRKLVIDWLAERGVVARCVVIADDENLDIARGLGFDVVERDNAWLGRKFNDGIEFAGRHGAEWVVPIGSDSWIDPRYFLPLPRAGQLRTSPLYAAVELGRGVALEVRDSKGAGPYMLPRILLARAGFRPAKDRLQRGVDASTIRGIGRPMNWRRVRLHPFQYVGFRGKPHITSYDALRDRWGVADHADPWPILAEHFPVDLVARARAALTADLSPRDVTVESRGHTPLPDHTPARSHVAPSLRTVRRVSARNDLIDAWATEPHFLDHIAPVWRALPARSRGDLVVPRALLEHAKTLGLEVVSGFAPEDRPTLVAAQGNLRKLVRDHGRGRVALLEHGSGQSFGGDPASARHSSYPGGGRRPASLFLSPNAHAAGRDSAAYPNVRVEIVGCPKLDELPEPEGLDKPVVAVSFHWSCTVCPETGSGWADFRGAIAALARKYSFIGHGHPRAIDDLSSEYRRFGIPVVRDFRDVVRQAAVYVNEGSSTLFEAAAAGLRVVVLNPKAFRQGVNHGLRFESDGKRYVGAANVGPQVRCINRYRSETANLLDAAIARALEDPPALRAAREAAVDVVYAFRTGAAKRAAEVLVDWAHTGAAVPAGVAA
jgi:hypothetical protein